MALKTGAELMNAFLIPLRVVEQGEKSGERVRNQGGMEMVFKDLLHLKTLAIERGICVLKEEACRPILEGSPKLTFPKLAGKGVPNVSQQQIIQASRGETRGAKPEEDKVPGLEVVIPGLDWRKSEAVGLKRDRHRRIVGRCHTNQCPRCDDRKIIRP